MHGHLPQQHPGLHPGSHHQPPPHLTHLANLPPHSIPRDHHGNRSRTTKIQQKMLVELMEKNPDVACGLRKHQSEFWKEATKKLNSIGPPFKEAASWRRVWKEKKYNAKRKMNEGKKHMDEIGGVIPEEMELDDIEERILSVTQLNKNAMREPECIYIKAEQTAVKLEEETGSSDTDSCDQEEGGPSNTKGSNDKEEAGPSKTEAKIDQDVKEGSQNTSARQPHDDDKIEILIRQNDAIIKFLSEISDSAKKHVEETKSFHGAILEYLKRK